MVTGPTPVKVGDTVFIDKKGNLFIVDKGTKCSETAEGIKCVSEDGSTISY